jgi:acetyl-CoA carboxylase biotin carboxyl carrier protein
MELKEIQQLIKFVSSSGVDEVELERKDFKLKIRKNEVRTEVVSVQSAPQIAAPVAQQVTQAAPQVAEKPADSASQAVSTDANLVEIKSPMIGTFYRSSSPDKPSFVNVGDEVTEGKVICIIEAMKLFNEIECEVKGRIVKVLVDDASPVEYDQPLFLVEPL